MHLPPDSDPGFAWLLELELPPESLLPLRHRGRPHRQDAIARAPEMKSLTKLNEGWTQKLNDITFESPPPLLGPYRTDIGAAGCQRAIVQCS